METDLILLPKGTIAVMERMEERNSTKSAMHTVLCADTHCVVCGDTIDHPHMQGWVHGRCK